LTGGTSLFDSSGRIAVAAPPVTSLPELEAISLALEQLKKPFR
jgi:hypothetical protein